MKYPFQPDILDSLPEPIAELMRGLEDRLIQEICSRLKIADNLNEVTVQAIRSLRALGIDLSDIEAAIAETAKITEAKLDELFDDVIARNQAYHTELMDLAGITAPAVIVAETDIEAIRRQTKGELTNLTQSLGFVVRKGGRVVEVLPPAKAYQRILDNAAADVEAGTLSYQQVITNATRELADGGMKKIRYEADGKVHIDQADVAARRAIMTGVNQICQKYTEQSVERLDTNLVEISAHSGARNTGHGPANHHQWQGKVYEWVKDGEKKTRHPDFVKTTGYGTGEGLGGWNCRHHYFPHIEGVSERTYTDDELEHLDNPPFAYEGKVYDQYAASQKQREIERTIRKLKRQQTAFEAAGLSDEARDVKASIRRLNAKYREFSEAADLPMQRERMRVLYSDSIPKTVEKPALRDTIKETISGGGSVQTVGRIDIDKYKVVTDKIRTDEVIITDERIQHIKERHPNDYERFYSYIPGIISDPDYIIGANKANTAVVLKEVIDNGEKFKLVLRLKVEGDPDEYKNSILTFWHIGETTWNKILKNKKILYKSE